MGVAFQAWDAGNVARTRELLARHRPKAGEPDLRTFEWRYLWGLARPRELLTIRSDSARDLGQRHLSRRSPAGDRRRRRQNPVVEPAVRRARGNTPSRRCQRHCLRRRVFSRWPAARHDRRYVGDICGMSRPGACWRRWANSEAACFSVAFSHDGKTLASMAGYPYALDTPAELTLWDVASQSKAGRAGRTHVVRRLDWTSRPTTACLPLRTATGPSSCGTSARGRSSDTLRATRGWSSACGSHRMVSCWHPEASMAPCGCGMRRHAARSPRSGPTREPCTLVAFSPDGESPDLRRSRPHGEVVGHRGTTRRDDVPRPPLPHLQRELRA